MATTFCISDLYQFHHEVIGKGSYSVVRKAIKRHSAELVAIKCIEKKQLNTAEELAIPHREIQALKSLPRHPNAVYLMDSFEDASHVFLVFELARKGTLADWLSMQPLGLAECDAKSVVKQLASAIDHVHSHGLVHVDITPRNVLIDDGGVVKLSDFGFAVRKTSILLGMRGSMNYASPELIRGDEFNESTDVWSLGVLAYETLTGFAPFSGSDNCSTLTSVPFPDSIWSGKPAQAKDFIAYLLTLESHHRPCIRQVRNHLWLN